MKCPYIILVVAVLGNQVKSFAQDDISKSVRANNLLTRVTQQRIVPGDIIMAFPSSYISEVVGDTYWDQHWGKSSILLYGNDIPYEGNLIRYDIYNDVFEVMLTNAVKSLPGAKVRNVVWIDSIAKSSRMLVNAKEYQKKGVPLIGFYEVLVEGSYSLFKKVNLEILKPNFSPALNVGSKDTRIVKKVEYYFNQGKELIRIKSKKDLIPIFEKEEKQMDIYIKKEGIKFSRESDLVKFFNYLVSVNR